jgi:hypothetical protein
VTANKPSVGRFERPQDVNPAATAVPDLEGQREPTEEEVIRHAIMRYLDELRGATPGNPDKLLTYPQTKAEFQEFLRNLPPGAVPIIAELLRKETDFVNRRLLIYGLADIGTDEAAWVLRDFFMERIGDVARGSEMRHVIWALGRSESAAAYDVLVEFLGNRENTAVEKLRTHYVESLGNHRLGYQAVPIFFDLLDVDLHDGVRNKAAQAIKNVGKRDPGAASAALPGLLESYKTEATRQSQRAVEGVPTHPYVKQTLLGAIGGTGDERAVPWLLKVGTTEGLPERLSAAAALSRIGGEAAMEALNEILINMGDKQTLVNAIGQLEEPRALPFLQEVVSTTESEALRQSALTGIDRVGGTEASEALRALLGIDLPDAVRRDVQRRLDRLTGGGQGASP